MDRSLVWDRIFACLPVRRVSLRDLRWHASDIRKDDLGEPERRREEDDVPIYVEQLSGGLWYIHRGVHRAVRALARGEHEIYARALTDSMRREPDDSQAHSQNRGETERADHTIFSMFDLWETERLPEVGD